MPEDASAPAASLDLAQAAELSVLVNLEARWENLRKVKLGNSLQELQTRQKTYDAFHTKLVAYNCRYTPTHIPEVLLNTPLRLALWCRKMRHLHRLVEQAPRYQCPVHLLEKAYRCANHLATRLHTDPVSRPADLPGTRPDTAGVLEELAQWCDALANVSTNRGVGPRSRTSLRV